ncbi:MAG: nucleoside hydrolase [Elusimicrobiota bacterium]
MMNVLFDHDAHVDDLLVLMMLQCAEGVRLLGTTVCPGDCFKEPGMLATRRFLDFFGSKTVAVAGGDDAGLNPFPDLWRADSEILANLKELGAAQGDSAAPSPSAVEFLSARLQEAPAAVSLLVTGPPPHLAAVLSKQPGLAAKIGRVWIMGGAVRVGGNVSSPGHDGTAEWNFFNHPKAADVLVRSGVPITLVSLDATNKAPVTREFLERLRSQAERYPVSKLALATWKVALRHIENEDYTQRYYFWDTLTAAAMIKPGMLKTEAMKIKVITEGPSQGRTVEDSSGNTVDVGVDVDREQLERLILELFRR